MHGGNGQTMTHSEVTEAHRTRKMKVKTITNNVNFNGHREIGRIAVKNGAKELAKRAPVVVVVRSP